MTNSFICDGCEKPKHNVMPRKSAILAGTQLLLCMSCINAKIEPKWCIVIAAQTNGLTPIILDYIRNHRYIGQDIKASEVIK